MAKPFRRKKRGKLVGNFFATVDGRDVNLQTKDAHEADRRARLAVRGKWPVVDAAAAAAVGSLDPAADAAGGPIGPEDPTPPPVPEGPPPDLTPPALPVQPPVLPVPLDDAAAAAAAEVSGTTPDPADPGAPTVDDEVKSIMSELSGPDGQLAEEVCDQVGKGLLWSQGHLLRLGVKWTTGKQFRPGPVADDSLSRRCLAKSLRALARLHLPGMLEQITPGWGLVLGLGLGAMGQLAGGEVVAEDGTVTKVIAPPPNGAPVEAPPTAAPVA